VVGVVAEGVVEDVAGVVEDVEVVGAAAAAAAVAAVAPIVSPVVVAVDVVLLPAPVVIFDASSVGATSLPVESVAMSPPLLVSEGLLGLGIVGLEVMSLLPVGALMPVMPPM
jgi:hypothetical protein